MPSTFSAGELNERHRSYWGGLFLFFGAVSTDHVVAVSTDDGPEQDAECPRVLQRYGRDPPLAHHVR